MYLGNFKGKGVRNLLPLELEFNPQLNLLIGDNGQGKTNLLEAIYFLATSRSFRTSQDQEMIQLGAGGIYLGGEVSGVGGDSKIELLYQPPHKEAKINGKSLPRLIDLIGHLRVVLFSAEDIAIIKGGPHLRRRFMDIGISQTDPVYLNDLQKYIRILKQRNRLLNEIRDGGRYEDLLDSFDESLVKTGRAIISKRRLMVTQIGPMVNHIHQEISGRDKELQLEYKPRIKEEDFFDRLREKRREEISRGLTLIGPHRDEIIFTLDGINARGFASEGEARTIAICLRLADLKYIYQQSGEYPLLILDDVFSELDEHRKQYLVNSLRGDIQTFVTAADEHILEDLPLSNSSIFRVKRGEVWLYPTQVGKAHLE
ncbi:MAG: DNA replication/repair protein RecF [bacterium]